MTQDFNKTLEQIDKLQGIIYKNLIETFNNLTEATNLEIEKMSSMQQIKHAILTKLKIATEYINGDQFKSACITCKAIRILGMMKYKILKDFTSDDNLEKSMEQIITDYKTSKKYTEDFYSAAQKLKNEIVRMITSKQLRKQFHLNDFCLQYLSKERLLLNEIFIDDSKIITPEWLEKYNQEELSEFCNKAILLIENQDWESFMTFTADK